MALSIDTRGKLEAIKTICSFPRALREIVVKPLA
jgi:hypothetical protein